MLNYTTIEDCQNFQGVGFVVQYNFTGLHTGPLYQSLADQALARYASNDPAIVIKTTIAPLPITQLETSFGQAEDAFLAWFLVSLSILLPGIVLLFGLFLNNSCFFLFQMVLSFPFIAGSFAVFVSSF